MAPIATRSMASGDPGYEYERYTPKKRTRTRKTVQEEARKKQKINREKAVAAKRGVTPEDPIVAHFGAEHVDGVRKCQETMNKTCLELTAYAEEIEGYNSPDTDISDKVRGDMEAFCGKSRLLVTSKMGKQYKKMLMDALSPTYEPPTKVSDLTGFWEMVELQLDQNKDEYESLLKLKKNNWVEVVEVKKAAPTKVLKPKVVNKPANDKLAAKNMEMAKARAEKMKAFKAQMKAKKEAQQQDENIIPIE